MKRDSLKHNFFWLGMLALLLSLHFWFPNVGIGPPTDSYSTEPLGKKAFFRLVQAQYQSAERNHDSLSRLIQGMPQRAKLCLLGTARQPTAAEWDMLLDWVRDGGELIVAARQNGFEIETLSVKVQPLAERVVDIAPSEWPNNAVTTSLVESNELSWYSEFEVTGWHQPVVTCNGTTQATIVETHGDGKVVIVASDYVFSNESLAAGENSVLAFRLLEAAGPSEVVVFDESLNSSGTPKVVGLFLEPFLRPVTVQLFIGLLLFAWWQSERFGPRQPSAIKSRHNIVDHTDNLGTLFFRSKNGIAVLKLYLSQLSRELRLRRGQSNDDQVFESIAARMGLDAHEIKAEFEVAEAAVKNESVEYRSAARIIRRLALIRAAVTGKV